MLPPRDTRSHCHRQHSSRSSVSVAALSLSVALSLSFLSSCKSHSDPDSTADDAAVHVPELHQNNLSSSDSLQSDMLLSQKQSPVHWQSWNKKTFENAKKEKKVITALIGSGSDPDMVETLKQINASSQLSQHLNERSVNVLIDANLQPELFHLIALSLAKTGKAPAKVMIAWFTYDGAPISLTSIPPHPNNSIAQHLQQSSSTVYSLWESDPEYVMSHSRKSIQDRFSVKLPTFTGEENASITTKAIRQASSFYDPTSLTIDGIGRIAPARYTSLLARASTLPGLSEFKSKQYMNIANAVAQHILTRGLIDPLDGGTFDGAQRKTCDLPIFTKSLKTQAQTMSSLYQIYQVTGDQKLLEQAGAIDNYIRKNLKLADGGYATSITYAGTSTQNNPCLWTLETLEGLLTPGELSLCRLAFGTRGLGNIPLEDDPTKSYFRQNTLTWKVPYTELISQSGLDEQTLKQRLNSISKKLAKHRTEQTSSLQRENVSLLDSSALLINAYTEAYRATGNSKDLQRAILGLNQTQSQFTNDQGELHRAHYHGKLLNLPALAIDYSLLCQAALNVHEITLDPKWLAMAAELHQTMTQSLSSPDKHYLSESRFSNSPMHYTCYQYPTFHETNNMSSWAIAQSNAYRLSLQWDSQKLRPQAGALRQVLRALSNKSCIAGIDFLSEDAKNLQPHVYLKAPIDPKLHLAAIQSSCRIIPITKKGIYPELGDAAAQLKPGGILITSQGETLDISDYPAKIKQNTP